MVMGTRFDGVLRDAASAITAADEERVARFKELAGGANHVVLSPSEVGAVCRRLSRLEAASTPGVLERYRARQDEVLQTIEQRMQQATKFGLGQQYDALYEILADVKEIFAK